MENLFSNIDELRKILNEEPFKMDEAIEFLDAVESDAKEVEKELDYANDELEKEQEKVAEFESQEEDTDTDSELDCGIGVIEYNQPDNLQLQDLMDNLELVIKKVGAKKTSDLLAAIS